MDDSYKTQKVLLAAAITRFDPKIVIRQYVVGVCMTQVIVYDIRTTERMAIVRIVHTIFDESRAHMEQKITGEIPIWLENDTFMVVAQQTTC